MVVIALHRGDAVAVVGLGCAWGVLQAADTAVALAGVEVEHQRAMGFAVEVLEQGLFDTGEGCQRLHDRVIPVHAHQGRVIGGDKFATLGIAAVALQVPGDVE